MAVTPNYITTNVEQWGEEADRESNKPGFVEDCPYCDCNLLEMEQIDDVLGSGGVYYRLYCHDCLMAAPWSDTKVGAVRNWAKMIGRMK